MFYRWYTECRLAKPGHARYNARKYECYDS